MNDEAMITELQEGEAAEEISPSYDACIEDGERREESLIVPDALEVTPPDYSDDIPELCAAFPELCGDINASGITGMQSYERYCAMRGAGLTPSEAYYALNGNEITKRRLDDLRRRQQTMQKSHIRSAVSQTCPSHPIMTEAQKRHARASLGIPITDTELERLWKRSHERQ